MMKRFAVTLTSSTTGGSVQALTAATHGLIAQIVYEPGETPFNTSSELDITSAQTTALVILDEDNISTAAFVRVPGQPTHDLDGSVSLLGLAYVAVAQEKIQVDITSTSSGAESGTFHIYVSDDGSF